VSVYPGSSVLIKGLTIRHGRYKQGAGIHVSGSLTLRDVRTRGNAAGAGGGIYNRGWVTLEHGSRIVGNTATSGGGIYNRGWVTLEHGSRIVGNTALSGGGIYDRGTLTLNGGSLIRGNTADAGGGVMTEGGQVTLNDASRIVANRAEHDGGAAYVTGHWDRYGDWVQVGRLTMAASSRISGNVAGGHGGGVRVASDGAVSGVICAPDPAANVYANDPDDCFSRPG
jgi:hypothetical protein